MVRIVRIVRISVGCRRVARRRWRVPLRRSSRSHCGSKRCQQAATEQTRSSLLTPLPPSGLMGGGNRIISRLEGSFLSITDVAIDKVPHPFKVSIAIHLVMSRSTSNRGIDTNPDTNADEQRRILAKIGTAEILKIGHQRAVADDGEPTTQTSDARVGGSSPSGRAMRVYVLTKKLHGLPTWSFYHSVGGPP